MSRRTAIFTLMFLAALSLSAAQHPTAAPGERISVDFPDESRSVILRNLADLYGFSVVLPVELTGRTNIKAKDKGWHELFDQILRPIGYDWREENGVVTVYDVVPSIAQARGEDFAAPGRIASVCVVIVAVVACLSLALNIVILVKFKRISTVSSDKTA